MQSHSFKIKSITNQVCALLLTIETNTIIRILLCKKKVKYDYLTKIMQLLEVALLSYLIPSFHYFFPVSQESLNLWKTKTFTAASTPHKYSRSLVENYLEDRHKHQGEPHSITPC